MLLSVGARSRGQIAWQGDFYPSPGSIMSNFKCSKVANRKIYWEHIYNRLSSDNFAIWFILYIRKPSTDVLI